ncbi:hypothetical protein [Lacimicrobium sp. SS2-24]|uniref:hypothetical protein n=1 Tax=Lacimicrobium sp. SS2-24 TaxID=2005569 RepID=UPI000B4B3402|nr:hypothetical protein [Lacimicrobium sp. SS2-24]
MKNIIVVTSLIVTFWLSTSAASASIMYTELDHSIDGSTQRDYEYSWFYDVNADGVDDFGFLYTTDNRTYSAGRWVGSNLYVWGVAGSQVTTGGPLGLDANIDGNLGFINSNHLIKYYYSQWDAECSQWGCTRDAGSATSHDGSWNDGYNTARGYLGFSLFDGTDTSFGWFNLTLNDRGTGTVHGYALESDYNTPILAGQTFSEVAEPDAPVEVPVPGTFLLLIAGLLGLQLSYRASKQLR